MRQLKKSIEKRLSQTLPSKDIFKKSIKSYQDSLKDIGFFQSIFLKITKCALFLIEIQLK